MYLWCFLATAVCNKTVIQKLSFTADDVSHLLGKSFSGQICNIQQTSTVISLKADLSGKEKGAVSVPPPLRSVVSDISF